MRCPQRLVHSFDKLVMHDPHKLCGSELFLSVLECQYNVTVISLPHLNAALACSTCCFGLNG